MIMWMISETLTYSLNTQPKTKRNPDLIAFTFTAFKIHRILFKVHFCVCVCGCVLACVCKQKKKREISNEPSKVNVKINGVMKNKWSRNIHRAEKRAEGASSDACVERERNKQKQCVDKYEGMSFCCFHVVCLNSSLSVCSTEEGLNMSY